MTRDEAAAAAAKLPLPKFESQEDEIFSAAYFAKDRSRHVACIVLGLSKNRLKSEWRAYRRALLEGRRFDEWCKSASAQWDNARGKYLLFYPDPAPAETEGK